MQFYSWAFLCIFLPIVLIGYYTLNKMISSKVAMLFLSFSSLCFYAYAGWSYLVYFAISILINYALSYGLTLKKNKKILVLGLVFNIGSLAILKYFNFFVDTLNTIFKTDFNFINIFVPLGISFYTFQFIGLLCDCYYGQVVKVDIVKYLAFSTFFPKIIQGPIMSYQEFDKQCDTESKLLFQWGQIAKGFFLLVIGFGKKMLIADVLGEFVNTGFASEYVTYNSTMSILLVLSYTLQIYFDFSGYTDIARGLGLMFQIELPRNFNSPYKAKSIDDFWKRWHMSLTSFLTKYLYFPLGGSRKGNVRTYINIFLVFLISGLWHGAGVLFILWGALHGMGKVIERKWSPLSKVQEGLQWLSTFAFVNITWVFFRATSLKQALVIIKNILRLDFSGVNQGSLSALILPEIRVLFDVLGADAAYRMYPILFILGSLGCVLFCKNSDEYIENFKPTNKKILITVFVLLWCILSFGKKITFIYEMF